MAKYEIQLTLYRTVEAADVDEAADIADDERHRLTDNGLAGDLGWTHSTTTVALQKETN